MATGVLLRKLSLARPGAITFETQMHALSPAGHVQETLSGDGPVGQDVLALEPASCIRFSPTAAREPAHCQAGRASLLDESILGRSPCIISKMRPRRLLRSQSKEGAARDKKTRRAKIQPHSGLDTGQGVVANAA